MISCQFIPRDNLSKASKDQNCIFEAQWIKIKKSTEKHTLVGVAYKHATKDSTVFLDHLQTVLNKAKKENKQVIISGYFNLNLLKLNKIACFV